MLKSPTTDALLYFTCINNRDSDNEGSGQGEDTPEMKQLLAEYPDVFRDTLPDQLPPVRDLEHKIDTGTNAPVNTQVYVLSNQQLKEQAQQIKDVLEQRLVQKSSSS